MKFAGMIGFEIPNETVPGVFKPTIVEKFYRGDIQQELRRLYSSEETTNQDIMIDDRIRIVSDPFAQLNYHRMKFVEHMGVCWIVKTVDIRNYPSILIYLGGVYNGERQPKSETDEET